MVSHAFMDLTNAMAGEMLQFENDVRGEVFNLEEDSIGAVIYGDYTKVKEGSDVHSTGRLLSIPVGYELLGRVVNPLCEPVDGGPVIKTPACQVYRVRCAGNSPASAGQTASSDRNQKY